MTENLRYDLRGLYNAGKRGIGSRNDGSTFEMTNANLASGVGYYTTTTNAQNYVLNPNTKSLSVTRYSYSGDTTGTEYYYTWTAATAGQGSTNNTSGTINGSICPAGWRLPTNYTDTTNRAISWSELTDVYLGTTEYTYGPDYQTLEQPPFSFYRAGVIDGGNQGSTTAGYYWSSTTYNAVSSYVLLYTTSYVRPQYNNGKFFGFQIRCLANR